MTKSELKQSVEAIATQAIGLGGVSAFVAGVHQIHPPSALIAGGVLAVAWAVLKSTRTP